MTKPKAPASSEPAKQTEVQRHRSLSWAQRLKRVFRIDIEICRRCGGRLSVIASIEAPGVIDRILGHWGPATEPLDLAHPGRGPPTRELPF